MPKDIGDASNPNVTPTHPLKELFVLLSGALGCIVGAYIALGFLVDWVVPKISFETEEKLAALFVLFDPRDDEVTDVERRLQTMVDAMQDSCTHLPYTISVSVVDEPAINAVALPGGRIAVFQGLLENVRSENEIAFILGHEMGHFANRDHLRGLGRALVLLVVSTSLFGADSSVSDFIADTITITEMSFSRAQETRADEYGLAVLNCRYGHVTGATDFFEKIPKESDPGRFGHYFSSHPENQRRIARLKRIAEEKKFDEGRRIQWKEGPAGLPPSSSRPCFRRAYSDCQQSVPMARVRNRNRFRGGNDRLPIKCSDWNGRLHAFHTRGGVAPPPVWENRIAAAGGDEPLPYDLLKSMPE